MRGEEFRATSALPNPIRHASILAGEGATAIFLLAAASAASARSDVISTTDRASVVPEWAVSRSHELIALFFERQAALFVRRRNQDSPREQAQHWRVGGSALSNHTTPSHYHTHSCSKCLCLFWFCLEGALHSLVSWYKPDLWFSLLTSPSVGSS